MRFSTSVFYMATFRELTVLRRQPHTTRGSLLRQCDT